MIATRLRDDSIVAGADHEHRAGGVVDYGL
jgi:hypothetical protein